MFKTHADRSPFGLMVSFQCVYNCIVFPFDSQYDCHCVIDVDLRGGLFVYRQEILMTRSLFDRMWVVLQETHITSDVQKIWRNEWGGEVKFSEGVSNSRGVMILFNKRCQLKVLNEIKGNMGRYIILLIEDVTANEQFALVSFYAPNM